MGCRRMCRCRRIMTVTASRIVAVFRPEFGGWYVDGLTTEFIGLST